MNRIFEDFYDNLESEELVHNEPDIAINHNLEHKLYINNIADFYLNYIEDGTYSTDLMKIENKNVIRQLTVMFMKIKSIVLENKCFSNDNFKISINAQTEVYTGDDYDPYDYDDDEFEVSELIDEELTKDISFNDLNDILTDFCNFYTTNTFNMTINFNITDSFDIKQFKQFMVDVNRCIISFYTKIESFTNAFSSVEKLSDKYYFKIDDGRP